MAKKVLQVRAVRWEPAARLGAPSSADDIGKLVRQRNPLINHAWITYIALLNVRAYRRAARHRRRGRVVICDRYVLDSIVHLRRKYGDHSRLGFETALIRAMSPNPTAAFLLDIDPELAFGRKPDEFGVADLREFRDLYQSECDALGVVTVDTAQPPEATCRAIAQRVWAALG